MRSEDKKDSDPMDSLSLVGSELRARSGARQAIVGLAALTRFAYRAWLRGAVAPFLEALLIGSGLHWVD